MHEVFEKIVSEIKRKSHNYYPSTDHYCVSEKAVKIGDIERAVKEVAAEYNNGWIPCSERLPTMHECQENDCRFIVTDGNRRYQAWFNIYDGFFEIPRNRDDIMREDKCVIAWQPLPSVWKGENNG